MGNLYAAFIGGNGVSGCTEQLPFFLWSFFKLYEKYLDDERLTSNDFYMEKDSVIKETFDILRLYMRF